MQIKNNNGMVNALLKTGKDLVKTSIPVAEAQRIINSSPKAESDQPGYIAAGDWYFEGEEIKVEKTEKFGKVGKH